MLSAGDVVVADAVEVLDDAAQAVAVGGDEHGLSGPQVVGDGPVPVGQQAGDDVLEALAAGQLRPEVGVAHVVGLGELVRVVDRRRRGVERAAPEHELLLAVLLEGLLLVLALEGAVVALVEAPAAPDRDPVPVGDVEADHGGADRAAQQGGVDDVGLDPGVAQLLPAAERLGPALLGEGHVDPAREEVLGVPDALAVAEQDQGVCHVSSTRRWGTRCRSGRRCRKATRCRRGTRSATAWRCRGRPTGRRRGRPAPTAWPSRRCRTRSTA